MALPEDWRILESSVVIDTPFLRLRRDAVALPDGTTIDEYYVRESRGFVVIFALTQDGDVLLVRQYKHGIGRKLLELPAGIIDEGEEPEEAARRELAEETGYTAPRWERVRVFVTDPTNSTSLAYLYLAEGAVRTQDQDLDPTEQIAVERCTFEGLEQKIADGPIDSVAHVASIYTVKAYLSGRESNNRSGGA